MVRMKSLWKRLRTALLNREVIETHLTSPSAESQGDGLIVRSGKKGKGSNSKEFGVIQFLVEECGLSSLQREGTH